MISALEAPRKYGWKRDNPKGYNRDLPFMLSRKAEEDLPRLVDLRPHMPPVFDQGELGACTGNAIAAALEYNQTKQGQKTFRPSRLFIYYNERVLEGTVDEDSGAQLRDGLRAVVKFGAPPEESGLPGAWPYHVSRFRTQPPAISYNVAAEHQALVYRRVPQNKVDILSALADGFPVLFGFTVFTQFQSDEAKESGTIFMPKHSDEELGGHAVLASGYDMGGYDVNDGVRILVRNSWSADWGKNGYCTFPIAYLLDRDLASDFWTISRVE